MNLKKSRTSKEGFTLIELLVVVSIIALLVSILMPALQRARKHAHQVVCASHLHQVGLTYIMYANDYGSWPQRGVRTSEEKIPIGSPIENVVPYIIKEYTYQAFKSDYQMEDEMWACPSLVRSYENADKPIFEEESREAFAAAGSKDVKSGELRFYYDRTFYGEYRQLGYVSLIGMVNMLQAEPSHVKESSLKPTGRSDKLLAADFNLRWDGTFYDRNSRVAHEDKQRVPYGGNRLDAGGAVQWVKSNVMAKDNTAITQDNAETVEGKFDHKSGGRAYFW